MCKGAGSRKLNPPRTLLQTPACRLQIELRHHAAALCGRGRVAPHNKNSVSALPDRFTPGVAAHTPPALPIFADPLALSPAVTRPGSPRNHSIRPTLARTSFCRRNKSKLQLPPIGASRAPCPHFFPPPPECTGCRRAPRPRLPTLGRGPRPPSLTLPTPPPWPPRLAHERGCQAKAPLDPTTCEHLPSPPAPYPTSCELVAACGPAAHASCHLAHRRGRPSGPGT